METDFNTVQASPNKLKTFTISSFRRHFSQLPSNDWREDLEQKSAKRKLEQVAAVGADPAQRWSGYVRHNEVKESFMLHDAQRPSMSYQCRKLVACSLASRHALQTHEITHELIQQRSSQWGSWEPGLLHSFVQTAMTSSSKEYEEFKVSSCCPPNNNEKKKRIPGVEWKLFRPWAIRSL